MLSINFDVCSNHRVQQDGSLYIPRVRKEDGGVYECQANNDQGESTLHVKLVIGGELRRTLFARSIYTLDVIVE